MLTIAISADAGAHRPQRADVWSTGLDRPTTSAPAGGVHTLRLAAQGAGARRGRNVHDGVDAGRDGDGDRALRARGRAERSAMTTT